MKSFMSAPSFMIANMPPNPWDRISVDWPHVKVLTEDLGSQWAETRWMRSGRVYVVLNERLNQAERRVCIAHECAHMDAGKPHGTLRASAEQKIRDATAAWLIPDLKMLGQTLASYDLYQAADELWVTLPVLVDRLNSLSDEDSLYVHSFREDNA